MLGKGRGDTQPTLKSARDEFDRLISWALAAETQNAHPSDEVWQRILHSIVDSDRTGQVPVQSVTQQSGSWYKLFVLPSYMGVVQYNPFVYISLALTYGM